MKTDELNSNWINIEYVDTKTYLHSALILQKGICLSLFQINQSSTPFKAKKQIKLKKEQKLLQK